MAQWTPPPKPSSPSSLSSASILKIPSSADDPGFKLNYHHIALTKLRGVKEMNETRIEALHARELSASPWPPPSLPRGPTTDSALGVDVLHPAVLNYWRAYLFALLNLGNRSAPTSGFGKQPPLTTVPSPLRGVLMHLAGIVGLRNAFLISIPPLHNQPNGFCKSAPLGYNPPL
jgi:hypothetical protein